MAKSRQKQRESRSARWIDARVRSDQRPEIAAVITDISYSGCRIEAAKGFEVGGLLEIIVPRLGSISAYVRWSQGRHTGAEFVAGSDSWLVPDLERARYLAPLRKATSLLRIGREDAVTPGS